MNVPTVWRLPLLEGLFSLLFLKSSDIRETLSSERDQNDNDDDDDVKRKSPQFIVTAALIRGLLRVLEDCLEHDEKDAEHDEKDETLKRRAKRLRKHVKESRERMETLVDTEKHWRRSPSELMGRMLASPLSLLHVCLKRRKYVVFSNVAENFNHDTHFNSHFVVRSIGLTLIHRGLLTLNITTRIRKL